VNPLDFVTEVEERMVSGLRGGFARHAGKYDGAAAGASRISCRYRIGAPSFAPCSAG
jgi:hypothetical protein